MQGKLGFGLMRLPQQGKEIDVPQVSRMVDMFLEGGFTYFDTAFVYPGSEEAIRKALVERHPRESYTLATKLFASANDTEAAAKKELETSLERTGAGYFDYYLLHCLMSRNAARYEEYGLWDFVQKEKARGRIRHIGFSFHDGPELLRELLTDHPETEFVQLQINYADWENPSVQSRANYEVARSFGKQVVIMEPVKGGKLADPPAEVRELFRAADPDASCASWAIRFAASLDGVLAVLSGMSNVAQMADNVGFMKDFRPLTPEESAVITRAQEVFNSSKEIPCTACRYCVEGCPQEIPIPEIFAAMNLHLGNGQMAEAKAAYRNAVSEGHAASDCIECRQCERACPQHLEITSFLKQAADLFPES